MPNKTGGTNSEVARKRMRGKDMRKSKQDAWSKNDEKLYKLMGGKSKTRYEEDQATYRDFGRTYGGPTDAIGVAQRKRREAGNFAGKAAGKKPKELKGTIKLNNDMKKLLLAMGVAQKPKPRKAVKIVKPKAKKNVKRGAK